MVLNLLTILFSHHNSWVLELSFHSKKILYSLTATAYSPSNLWWPLVCFESLELPILSMLYELHHAIWGICVVSLSQAAACFQYSSVLFNCLSFLSSIVWLYQMLILFDGFQFLLFINNGMPGIYESSLHLVSWWSPQKSLGRGAVILPLLQLAGES